MFERRLSVQSAVKSRKAPWQSSSVYGFLLAVVLAISLTSVDVLTEKQLNIFSAAAVDVVRSDGMAERMANSSSVNVNGKTPGIASDDIRLHLKVKNENL